MTSLVDEITWEAAHDAWSDQENDSRSETAHEAWTASELSSPPPYGYRYLEGVGYHPYVSDPDRRSLWRIVTARVVDRWAPRPRGAHAAHAAHGRYSASLRRQRLLVGIAVAGVVAILAAVLGATTPWAGSGRAGTTHIQSTSATQAQTRGTTPPSTSPSPSGSGGQSSATPPTSPPVTLAPGLFSAPSTSHGGTTTAPAPNAPATRPASGGTKPTTAPTSTASAPTAPSNPITTPTTPVTTPTIVTTPPSPDAAWWATNGTAVATMQFDAAAIQNNDLPNVLTTGNPAQVAQSCVGFGNEVDALQRLAFPDSNLVSSWQAGISDFQNAAQACTFGLDTQDQNVIDTSAQDLGNGLSAIGSVVQVLSSAH